MGERDRRLSKRDRDAGIDEMLLRFGNREALIGHVAAITGLIDHEEPLTCDELLSTFDPTSLGTLFPDNEQILWR